MPMTMGSPLPTRQTGNSCTKVPMPAMNMAFWMSVARKSSGRPGRRGDDRDGREVRHEHGQHVLQAIGEGRKPANLAIKGRERLHLRVDERHAALAFHVSLAAHERNSIAPVAGSMASTMARDCRS